jgi:hypothetical protein
LFLLDKLFLLPFVLKEIKAPFIDRLAVFSHVDAHEIWSQRLFLGTESD